MNARARAHRSVARFNNHILKSGTTRERDVARGCPGERARVISRDRIFRSWNFQSYSLRHVTHARTQIHTRIHVHRRTCSYSFPSLAFTLVVAPLRMRTTPNRDALLACLQYQRRRICENFARRLKRDESCKPRDPR